jgi:hypothetical protein
MTVSLGLGLIGPAPELIRSQAIRGERVGSIVIWISKSLLGALATERTRA